MALLLRKMSTNGKSKKDNTPNMLSMTEPGQAVLWLSRSVQKLRLI